MNMQRQIGFQGDGRIMPGPGELQGFKVSPPPEVVRILPNLDIEMMRFIMLNDPKTSLTNCYLDRNPEDLRDSGLFGRLMKLNIVKVFDVKGAKGPDSKPCATAVKIEFTDLFGAVQGYYYTYLSVLMNPVR